MPTHVHLCICDPQHFLWHHPRNHSLRGIFPQEIGILHWCGKSTDVQVGLPCLPIFFYLSHRKKRIRFR